MHFDFVVSQGMKTFIIEFMHFDFVVSKGTCDYYFVYVFLRKQ